MLTSWNGSGAEGSRTLDLLNAIQALSQLSYGPTGGKNPSGDARIARQRGVVNKFSGSGWWQFGGTSPPALFLIPSPRRPPRRGRVGPGCRTPGEDRATAGGGVGAVTMRWIRLTMRVPPSGRVEKHLPARVRPSGFSPGFRRVVALGRLLDLGRLVQPLRERPQTLAQVAHHLG